MRIFMRKAFWTDWKKWRSYRNMKIRRRVRPSADFVLNGDSTICS